MLVAMAQILVEGGAVEANLTRAVARIAEAAAAGCDVVVLPECLDVGWTHPSAPRLACTIPGPISARICLAAAEHGIYVVAGLTEKKDEDLYNSAILVDNTGEIRLIHRKINILDIAADLYRPGSALHVAETPWGGIGLLICADNFPDKAALGGALYEMGARTILSPCAWAVAPDFDETRTPYGDLWLDSYGTLTRDRDLTIVGVSNVGPITGGPWVGHRCIGKSLTMGPDGTVLAVAPFSEIEESLTLVTCPMPSQS